MVVRFDLKTLLCAAMLLGACGEDPAPGDKDQQQDEDSVAGDKDASAGKDAGKDAGKADSGSSRDEEDEDDQDDDSAPDAEKSDAGPAKADAGRSTADAGGKADAGASADSCAELTYAKFGQDFFDTYCTSCHATQKPTFKTLASIASAKAMIKDEAVTAKKMPPKGAEMPTDAERVKLGQFLDCGPK